MASFFGFDQTGPAHLVKTEHFCQPRAEKRGSRCETAPQFGQNRKKLPGGSERKAAPTAWTEGRIFQAPPAGGTRTSTEKRLRPASMRALHTPAASRPECEAQAARAPPFEERRGLMPRQVAEGTARGTGEAIAAGRRRVSERPCCAPDGAAARPCTPSRAMESKRRTAPQPSNSQRTRRLAKKTEKCDGAKRQAVETEFLTCGFTYRPFVYERSHNENRHQNGLARHISRFFWQSAGRSPKSKRGRPRRLEWPRLRPKRT